MNGGNPVAHRPRASPAFLCRTLGLRVPFALRRGGGDHKGSPLRFVVPDLIRKGEGLGLAAGVDEDDWYVGLDVSCLNFGD